MSDGPRLAYSATGGAWEHGPARIYDVLADVLVAACPGGVDGGRVLDVGAGTGAATRAAFGRGARCVVALDYASGMLRHDARERPAAVVGDAAHLPIMAGAFDAVVAAFSINHLTDPVAGLRESRRALRTGGGLAVSAYATDDTHPVKTAVEDACTTRGWVQPGWYNLLKADAVPLLATVDRAQAAAQAAGLCEVHVHNERVAFPDLDADDLIRWRLGMAPMAPFVAALDPVERADLEADACDRLGDAPPLVRSVIVITAVA